MGSIAPPVVNAFRTAIPFWEQITWILSDVCP